MNLHRFVWVAVRPLAFVVPVALGATSFGMGCSSTSEGAPPGSSQVDAGDGLVKPMDIEIACADDNATLDGDPGPLPDEKGAILKCAPVKVFTKSDLEAALRNRKSTTKPESYTGKALTSGAKVYRIVYRTERGSVPPRAGSSVALVYLPDTPAAEKVPAVIFAHGSAGQAPQCAPSIVNLAGGQGVGGDFEAAVLPVVGLGLPVIAPDGAGYSNYGAAGNPPSGYNAVDDVGRSTLDAGRALAKLIATRFNGKVALLGHSQGGHSALSALALSGTYGTAGMIAAIATHAPSWFSQRNWGGIFLLESGFKVNESAAVPVSIWYHYTHGELLDGPGRGLDPFKSEIRAKIKDFVDTVCWSGDYPKLKAIGTVASDFFDPQFVSAVSSTAGLGGPCPTDPALNAICERWIPRYLADRPKTFAGSAANVPILVTRGALDTTIPNDYFACGVDALSGEVDANARSPLSFCFDPNADHGGIVRAHNDYAVEWIMNKTMGTALQATCPGTTNVDAVDDAGAKVACPRIPPND
jgi:pimeloyl-ACP methyl ester carboxylesterase